MKKFTPSSTVSDQVSFLLRGAKKRRSMALLAAKNIQRTVGVASGLILIKNS